MQELPENMLKVITELCEQGSVKTQENTAVDNSQQSLICGVPHKFISARFENTENRLSDKVRDFAEKGTGVFIITGSNGTGKTRIACCAINHRIDNYLRGGRYISCFYEVCPLIRSSRSFSAKVNEIDTLEEFYTTPFLVLDEVGKGDDNPIAKTFVTNVLAARYDNDLPTLITTNLVKSEFIDFIGSDITSRLQETAMFYNLDDKNWRVA